MRQKWLEIYAETGSVTKTALRCGIARSTLYRWINREKEQGKSELSDKSKRPSRLANIKMTPEIETIILNLRETRRWGAQRIANYLLRLFYAFKLIGRGAASAKGWDHSSRRV